ncbi:hypothetical protein SPHINGO361_150002 [Sphingomonas sp. EC-HK361]|nr:hypothetical protein SPHINGO361_150002 [Sphingomonas sp. EC-HK361]
MPANSLDGWQIDASLYQAGDCGVAHNVWGNPSWV